jgi:uncharacterized membrane protein
VSAWRKAGLTFAFLWFAIGGIAHFAAPEVEVQIIPPQLPFRMAAVYISGFFELAGAAGLLFAKTRRAAGLGLFALTIAVTPANVYIWLHPELFPAVPEWALILRLFFQVALLACIWLATQPRRSLKKP